MTETATLLYMVKRLELAVRAGIDEVVSPTGITTVQYTALTILERHPTMTAAALARSSFVRAQTAGHLVTTLESRGLIERRTDPVSRRQSLISLTEAGSTLLESLRKPVAEVERRMTQHLEPSDCVELARLLRACNLGLGSDVLETPDS